MRSKTLRKTSELWDLTKDKQSYIILFMSDLNSIQKTVQKGDKPPPMVTRNIAVPLDFWEDCKQKAGIRPLSAVIRKLLEMWLKGEIKIE